MEKHYLLQFADDDTDRRWLNVKGSLIIDEFKYIHRYAIVEQAINTDDYSNLDEEYLFNIWVSLENNLAVRYKHITDLMNCVTCTELTNEEYGILTKFGFCSVGCTNFWNRISEAVSINISNKN